MFALEAREDLLVKIETQAANWLGIEKKCVWLAICSSVPHVSHRVKKKTITLEDFTQNRLGSFRSHAVCLRVPH